MRKQVVLTEEEFNDIPRKIAKAFGTQQKKLSGYTLIGNNTHRETKDEDTITGIFLRLMPQIFRES